MCLNHSRQSSDLTDVGPSCSWLGMKFTTKPCCGFLSLIGSLSSILQSTNLRSLDSFPLYDSREKR